MWMAGQQLELGSAYYLSLLSVCVLLAYQQYLIKDRLPDLCLKAFLNNNWVGAVIFVGVVLSHL
jgi:4-hydroxybenzoate polyprenyltransferase